ncbi:Chlorophyllase - like 1 [Theobroma cacao]|nr:Chlorophyllase - like 1 [Theobroma cacao]
MAQLLETKLVFSTLPIFILGNYHLISISVDPSGPFSPPKPLLILTPSEQVFELCNIIPPNGSEEVECAAKVVDWLPSGLSSVLFENVEANLVKLAFVGHNRVTVINTGLGLEAKNYMMLSCTFERVNHEEFFNECKPSCAHFVAKNYGHMDVLDDAPSKIIGKVSDYMCVNGKCPIDPMRKCVGGIVVASLNFYFEGEKGDFMTIVN